MSAAKRSRQRHSEGRTISPQPASKRLKTALAASHVPRSTGLDFLVDENARHGRKLKASLTNGVPNSKASRLDESHAVVAQDTFDSDDEVVNQKKLLVIELSSAEEDSSDEESGEGQSTSDAVIANGHVIPSDDEARNGRAGDTASRERMDIDAAAGAEQDDEGGLSLGEVLRARHSEIIDVQASFADPSTERSALIPSGTNRGLSAPSGNSLGTVLTQSLKTNDRELLESCFQVDDMQSVRATIERLNSQLVVTLLQHLAERIHKRPGRTQKLMVWVQWSLVVHGGYLATQPALMKKLRSLSQVVRERASGLQPLLHLKGKLDLLWAQLDLQKKQRKAVRGATSDDEDEENVIYVEGQNDRLWSDEETATSQSGSKKDRRSLHGSTVTSDVSEAEADSGDDAEDVAMDAPGYEDDSEDEEHSDAEGGLIDAEAEETDNDDDEDQENSEDEPDSSPSESEDEDEDAFRQSDEEIVVKKPALKTLNRKR